MGHLSELHRFRIVKLSDDLQKEFGLPEIICADPDGMPFLEGQAFWAWLVNHNACQPATATNYLKSVLQFLTFLWFGSSCLLYSVPVKQIRNRVQDYLKEKLGCAVRPHPQGNRLVTASRSVTRPSARLYLVALKRFYECALLKGWYTEANPLAWEQHLALRERAFTPTMPPKSGMTLPAERRGRRPETYFCVVANDWKPHVIDDPGLANRLIPAFPNPRDRVIARILFESGARVSEVLGLTLGDWRRVSGQRHGALAMNKGSWGERVKELWWSSETTQQLRNYVQGDRRHCVPLGPEPDDLPDTALLFLTDDGKTYTYPAFYYHWQRACERTGIRVTPHQARHWFVTMALRRIQAVPDEDRREAYRERLIAYMHWKNPETIKAYDHHLRLADFTPIHTAISALVQSGPARVSEVNSTQISSPAIGEISQAMWERLGQLLDEE
jgi:integrase